MLGFGEGPDVAPLGADFGLEVVEGEVDDVFVVDPGGAKAGTSDLSTNELISQDRYRSPR